MKWDAAAKAALIGFTKTVAREPAGRPGRHRPVVREDLDVHGASTRA